MQILFPVDPSFIPFPFAEPSCPSSAVPPWRTRECRRWSMLSLGTIPGSWFQILVPGLGTKSQNTKRYSPTSGTCPTRRRSRTKHPWRIRSELIIDPFLDTVGCTVAPNLSIAGRPRRRLLCWTRWGTAPSPSSDSPSSWRYTVVVVMGPRNSREGTLDNWF